MCVLKEHTNKCPIKTLKLNSLRGEKNKLENSGGKRRKEGQGKRKRGRGQEKKIFQWKDQVKNGKKGASELNRNIEDHARSRSMIANAGQDGV